MKYVIPFIFASSIPVGVAVAQTDTESDYEKGQYIFDLSGCASCHTKDQPLAGGLAMDSDFGTFYTPNITPSAANGIGGWSQYEFNQALRNGISPDGEHYYPAFPYTSYQAMTNEDLRVLKVYLDSQPAIEQANLKHDVSFPFDQRELLGVWKWLFLDPLQGERNAIKTASTPQLDRGAYIANALGHCSECHTPRHLLGGLRNVGMIGNANGPEGESVPALTGPKAEQFNSWSLDDLEIFLEMGMSPSGDFAGGSMGHVIDNSTSKLTDADRSALANYLLTLSEQ